jgi:UDP-2-acetamido-3-amino-2,3-dideoxy-glucuronate N-acetyltransferase
VGAGSVITKDVPAFALVYGNPAQQRGWMSTHGHRLAFDEAGHATCPESGEQYQLSPDQQTVIVMNELSISTVPTHIS